MVVRTGGQTVEGKIVGPAEMPRSYTVKTPTGEIRRNRSQLTVVPTDNLHQSRDELNSENTTSTQLQRRIATRSQTGTEIIPPEQYGL